MSSPTPLNNVTGLYLAAPHASGSTTLVLNAGAGDQIRAAIAELEAEDVSSDHPVRVTVARAAKVNSFGQIVDRTELCIFDATELSGDTLGGLEPVEGKVDLDFAIGDRAGFFLTAGMLATAASGGPILASQLPNSGVAPGTYALASLVVDVKGRITSATDVSGTVIKTTGNQSKAGVLTMTDKHVINLVGNTDATTCQIIPAISVPGPSDVIWGEGMSSNDVGPSGWHPVFSYGFNCAGNGGSIDPTKVMVRDAQEYRYPQGDTHQSERHVAEITYPAGLGGVAMATSRPITINSYHETRKNSISLASSAWGWQSEFLDYALGSFNWDPDTLTTSVVYQADNVSGFSLALSPSVDSLSFGRATAPDTLVELHGEQLVLAMQNDTTSAQFRLLAGSDDLELVVGGILALSIDGPTSATRLEGDLDVAGDITGTIAQDQVTGLAGALAGMVDLDSDQDIDGRKNFLDVLTCTVVTGAGPNAAEVRGTGGVLLWFVDSNGNLTCQAASARVTLGANAFVYAHDGSNGTLQNNAGNLSVMNVSPTGVLALGTNGANRLVIDQAGAGSYSGAFAFAASVTVAELHSTGPVYADLGTATYGATTTFDMSLHNDWLVVLAGNPTLAVTNVRVGQRFNLILDQGTGGRTVAWFSGISWQNGTVPTLTATAAKRDVFNFWCISSGVYLGSIVGLNY